MKGKETLLKNACGLRGGTGPDAPRCPECGEPVKQPESSPQEEEIFDDIEFIYPACCCGMYIELKEDEK